MKKYVIPVLSLFLITACVVGLLALTNHFTMGIIQERERCAAEEALEKVLPGGAPYTNISNIVEDLSIDTEAKFTCANQSDKGYVFTMVSKGYGGDIIVYVGINNEGKVVNIMLGDNEETPNLGKKAELPEFTSQFSGLSKEDEIPDKIDYITRATITTDAVIVAVESALEIYSEVTK
jgi:electron transport complex protein RnfG